ncbi:MAG: thiamine transport system permease protein [Spirochaetes bacterium]|nr:MAG: thiamine transport system permease protein [Spirochaetota bacterium]
MRSSNFQREASWVFLASLVALSLLPLAAFGFKTLGSVDGVAEAVGATGSAQPEALWATLKSALLSESTAKTLRFTLAQAGFSTLFALLLGLPGAYLVAKFSFPGRKLFLSLAAVPFCLPPLLVVLAFILYYGKTGWFSSLSTILGIPKLEYSGILYTFWGLVLVHAFYNFPLVIQNLGSLWSRLPSSRVSAARTMGASPVKAFFVGTLPYLLPALLQSASLIFLFCFFSFTIVLVFGGLAGSTLEVGIYRALRFSNDRSTALALAILQTFVALACVGSFAFFSIRSFNKSKGFGAPQERGRPGLAAGFSILIYMGFILVFFLGPLASLAVEAFTLRDSRLGAARFGFGNFASLVVGLRRPLVTALINSLSIGLVATAAALVVGFLAALALTGKKRSSAGGGKGSELAKSLFLSLPLAVSPAIVSAGWSSILQGKSIFLIIAAAETALVWPFVAKSLESSLSALELSKREAARTLGATGLVSVLSIEIPAILPSVASTAAFAFSIVAGDVNIPLVLGGGTWETLPLLLYRLSSSYRFNEACAVGIVLALLTSVAFFMKENLDDLP